MKKTTSLVCETLTDDLSGVSLKEVELPKISSDQLLIKVKAASVNFPDLLMTQGKYQHKPELPFVLGMEGAGIVEERFSQLQELEAILEYLNIELRRLRSKTFRKFLENYNKLLSSRDAEKYVDGETDVVDMTKIVNDFALIRNQWLGITKGLDQKQWQITNIVKLRVAGMEDADIK